METTYQVFKAIIPIFLIIGCGGMARLFGWLDASADRSLMKLVINLLYPALIFRFILGNDVLRDPENLILPPLFGLSTVVFGFLLSLFVANKFKIGSEQDRRTFSFITGIQNSTYFPLPIIAVLFDRDTIGILLVYNLGVEIAVWLLGVGFILSPKDSKSLLQRIASAPVIAIILATWINYVQLDSEVPEFASKSIQLLGQCAIPLGLVLIGATLADFATNIKLFTRLNIPLIASALRLAVFPAVFLLVAFFLPLSLELKRVVVVQAAMPCAVFPIVLARHFDGSPDVAFKIVLATTLLSFATIPLWIWAGIQLLGL